MATAADDRNSDAGAIVVHGVCIPQTPYEFWSDEEVRRFDRQLAKLEDDRHVDDVWAVVDVLSSKDPLVYAYDETTTTTYDAYTPYEAYKNPTAVATTPTTVAAPCRHRAAPFPVPRDGAGSVTVYASSYRGGLYSTLKEPVKDAQEDAPRPDYGVYLASAWASEASVLTTPHVQDLPPVLDESVVTTKQAAQRMVLVNWPDHETPAPPLKWMLRLFGWTLEKAASAMLEVACIGGHGRTGTFLAALAAYATPSMTPPDAVEYVWSAYCDAAVESRSQALYVASVYEARHGEAWRAERQRDWERLLDEVFPITSLRWPGGDAKSSGDNDKTQQESKGGTR